LCAPKVYAEPSTGVTKYDNDGVLIDTRAKFLEAGLEVDVVCKHSENGHRAKIIEIDENTIHMQSLDKKTTYTPSIRGFKDEWEIVMDRDELKDHGVIGNWEQTLASSHEGIEYERAKAQVHIGLMHGQFYADKMHPAPCLHIQTKPEKKVVLEEDMKAQPHP